MTALTDNPNKTKTMHEALRLMPYGIHAVGVGTEDGQRNAFIASWTTQCSFEPALFLVAMRKETENEGLVKAGGAFSVSFLSKEQTDLARQLVKPKHQVGDKLSDISHFTEATDTPILKDAVAYLECKLVSTKDAGDHVLAIGEVVNAGLNESRELLMCSDIGWTYAG